MLNKLKNIFSGHQKKEEPPAELPEVRPFESLEAEPAPASSQRPDHAETDINHAGHMRIIAKSDEEAAMVGKEALKFIKDKKTVIYGEDMVSAYLSDFPYLKLMTVAKNDNTLCTFPFFNVGKPIGVRINKVIEYNNGYEGRLEVYAKGSTLTFFDTLYFKNKNKYYPGMDARALISGIAYVLTRVKGEAAEDEKAQENGLHDQELVFRYENGSVDDYVFRGRVEDTREFNVLGRSAQAIEVSLHTGTDSIINIYVCVTENVLKEKIHKGDNVSGIMWLQGFTL